MDRILFRRAVGMVIFGLVSAAAVTLTAPAAEPLAALAPLAPGAKQTLAIPLRHAGTFMCDLRLLGDGQARPAPDHDAACHFA